MPSLLSPLLRSGALVTAVNTIKVRPFHSTAMSLSSKIKPAARVAGRRQDVW